eukprot:1780452-Amphidinium_carterae.1
MSPNTLSTTSRSLATKSGEPNVPQDVPIPKVPKQSMTTTLGHKQTERRNKAQNNFQVLQHRTTVHTQHSNLM